MGALMEALMEALMQDLAFEPIGTSSRSETRLRSHGRSSRGLKAAVHTRPSRSASNPCP